MKTIFAEAKKAGDNIQGMPPLIKQGVSNTPCFLGLSHQYNDTLYNERKCEYTD